MHSLNSWKPFSPCYRSVLSHVGVFGSRRKWIRKISFRGNVAIWNVLQVNTLRSCWGREVFSPLHDSRKIIWVVQNSELGSPSHNNSTLCPLSTQTSVQKASQVSSPKTIKCDLSYSMLLAFAHCDLALTEDSLQSVPKGRKSKKSPGMLQSDDLASRFLLPECFCNNSLVGCTVYTSNNGSTSQHKQASFNIGTTYMYNLQR